METGFRVRALIVRWFCWTCRWISLNRIDTLRMFIDHGSVIHRIKMIHRSDTFLEDFCYSLRFRQRSRQWFDPISFLTFWSIADVSTNWTFHSFARLAPSSLDTTLEKKKKMMTTPFHLSLSRLSSKIWRLKRVRTVRRCDRFCFQRGLRGCWREERSAHLLIVVDRRPTEWLYWWTWSFHESWKPSWNWETNE